MGYRITGSADLFQGGGRRPQASINFITAHDGFTLHDLVTYGQKHNDANGEHNRDGIDDNQSWNCGVEGETDDKAINQLRDRQKRNLFATMLLSQGVPMISAGDEMNRTQGGNNNAYCQDNEISWVNWELDERGPSMLAFAQAMIKLRRNQPVLQRRQFFRGDHLWDSRFKDLAWFRPDGTEMTEEDWGKPFVRSISFLLGGDALPTPDAQGQRVIGDALLVLMNAHHEPITFVLPMPEWGGQWELEAYTDLPGAPDKQRRLPRTRFELAGRSLAVQRERTTEAEEKLHQ